MMVGQLGLRPSHTWLSLSLSLLLSLPFSACCLHTLSLQLEGDAKLVATGVEVLAINQRRQSQSDTVTQLLLIAQTDLALVVDLGAYAGILVQVVLGTQTELGRVRARSPRQLDGGLQTIVAPLVDQTTKLTSIVDVSVQDKVTGRVANGKVVGGDLRLLRVKCNLVAGQPALVASDTGRVDERSAQIDVEVGINAHAIMRVGSLEASRFASGVRDEHAVERHLQSLHQLVLDRHLRGERVVCVPFLREVEPVLLHLVLGLERTEHLAGILVRVAARAELHTRVGLGLNVQLPQTEVVAFVEDIAGLLAEIRVRWWCHF
uniref:Putative secreted protein n=1 Tax=Anopheles darlingi TaxID=43151 RepID=A0A2M4CZW9_ANODA